MLSDLSVHFSSGKDDWETPDYIFQEYNRMFEFDIDLCANDINKKCPKFISEEQDSLSLDWSSLGKTGWCNPPYSRGKQKLFIQKASEERLKGFTTVCLIPSRTDTKMFHKYIWDTYRREPREGVMVDFLEGRITFVGAKDPAPFPSIVVTFLGV